MNFFYKGIAYVVVIAVLIQPIFASSSTKSFVYSKNIAPVQVSTIESSSLTSLRLPLSTTSKNSLGASEYQNDYVEGEVLVKYKKNKINLDTPSGKTKSTNFAASKSLEHRQDLEKSNISVLKIKDKKPVEQLITELEGDSNVEYVQPNFQYHSVAISSDDTHKANLWGLDNTGQTVNSVTGTSDADIDAPEAWSINEGTSTSVIVAVIDSGVAYNHPDLTANMWDGSSCVSDTNAALGGCNHGYDYENDDKTPLPSTVSHGTHVAGTIAAVKNNTTGIIGVSPNAEIMAIKTSLTTVDNVKSINFAKHNGASVINASWGGASFDQTLKDAIDAFPGIFVAAAGNDATNNETSHLYPSDFNSSNIISVAATDQDDGLASFSNYGATSVDVGAPGTNIYSTVADSPVLNETFEGVATPAVPAGWVKGGTANNWGTYDFGTGPGKVLYGDYSNVPYANNADTTVTSPTYNLAGVLGATISFLTQCDTQYSVAGWYDYMALEFSSDGTNFTEVLKWDEAYLDSAYGDTDPAGSAAYQFQDLALPSGYLTANFKLRFRWVTDASAASDDGCFVDNVEIAEFGGGSDEQYDYMDGTSMAAPHVAALAALIEGYNPTLTPSEIISTIITTGDSVASLSGKTVSGKRINAQSALLAVTPGKAITAFDFTSPSVTGVINEGAKTIALTVPFGTDVTTLVPTISVSAGATTSPLSGVANNFTTPATYTVTAVDSATQDYMVTVTVAPASSISTATSTTYTVSNGASTITGVPYATTQAAFLAAMTKDEPNQTWDTSGLSDPVVTGDTLLITAQDGVTTKTYTLTVALNPAKDITSFSFPEGVGNISGTDIAVTVPYGTVVTALVPTIGIAGDSVSPLSGVAQDFTNPVDYTVTAADASIQVYTVTVTVAPNTEANILSFDSSSPIAVGGIAGTDITLTVPYGTSLTDLPITITLSDGASVLPVQGNTTFVDGSPVTYTVTAQDGSTTQDYTVTVNVAANTAKDITSFSFPEGVGNISGTDIAVTVPYGTVVTALVPTIGITGDSVSPLSGVAQDFTNPVDYTVTAADTSTQVYAVTVTVAPPSDIATTTSSSYTVSAGGTAAETITNIPYATTQATFLAAVTKGESNQTWDTSGLSDPVASGDTLVVTAQDGTTVVTYTLTVIPPSPIVTATSTTYTVSNGASTITGVPYATTQAAFLAAMTKDEPNQTWDTSGLSDPVVTGDTLFITAQDGVTTKTYTLTVALNPAKAIAEFTIAGQIGTTTINEGAHTITIIMPYGTNVTNLTSSIDITGASVSPLSGVAQDFTNPVDYTVTAADSTTQIYSVTVQVLLSTQTAPDINGDASISSSTPQVVITNPDQPIDITITEIASNPSLDVSQFISGGTGVLPAIVINSSLADIYIPAGVTITSADAGWSGTISAPTATSVTLPSTSGVTKTLNTAIAIGLTDTKLSFDKAVRILIPDQAGEEAGYIRDGISFTEISSTCSADTQAAGDALSADGDCKRDVGSDLVIWTKHFTSFAVYTETSDGGGGSGGGGGSSSESDDTDDAEEVAPFVPSAAYEIDDEEAKRIILLSKIEALQKIIQGLMLKLGKQSSNPTPNTTHQFANKLKVGDENYDVLMLQKKLNSLGFTISASGPGSPGNETQYYGPLTTKALKNFQCNYHIICYGTPYTTGYGNFGPMTRAKMNGV